MLAELVDHVIGIDPDKDWITAAVIESSTTRVIDSARFAANRSGYEQAISWADGHSSEGERAWAIEGSASFGRGLTVALSAVEEWVIEFDWARKKPTKDGAKSDELAAIQAAREVLGRDNSTPQEPTTGHEKPYEFTPLPGPAQCAPVLLPSTNSKLWSSPRPMTSEPNYET